MTKAAIWARVSTEHQENRNQFGELRAWAGRTGWTSRASTSPGHRVAEGQRRQGQGVRRQRKDLLAGAQLGHYELALVWAIDRLRRRGIEDTLSVPRQLYERGCDVWSHQEPWLVTSEPRMRELLIAFMAWMAQQESARRSGRIKADIERRRRDIAAGRIEGTVGGREQGHGTGGDVAATATRQPGPRAASGGWQPSVAASLASQRVDAGHSRGGLPVQSGRL